MDVVGRVKSAAGRARGRASGRDGGHPIHLEYPISPEIRWGYGAPPHRELAALVEAGREEFAGRLTGFLRYVDDLATIPLDQDAATEPDWNNGWFQGLDAVALYALIRDLNPDTYLEIGSGNSTLFARRAIGDGDLGTRVVSIDPRPRAGVDQLCDELVREPFERADIGIADRLRAGDVLFVDGSHYSFQNSDVTVVMLEVLPRLAPGVWVHFHDIFLPWDYPPQFRDRWYNEQYLLAAWLLAGDRASVRLPNFWISTEPELHTILSPLWRHLIWSGTPVSGLSFWLETH